MAHEQALEELGVEAVDGRHGVDDRVLGRQLHHDRDVAELEVGVDEHDRSVGLPGKDDGEVGRHHRFARSTLGGEDADKPALLTRALGFNRCARDNRQRLGGSFDGFDELATVGGRRHHVANASPERLLQHLGGQLLDHHDRGHLGAPAGEAAHLLEPVRARVGRAEDDNQRCPHVDLVLHGLDGGEGRGRHTLTQLHG